MKDLSLKKKILLWSLFIVIFTVVPLALIEGGGRLYIHIKYGVPGKTYGLWRHDDTLGAIHNENAYNLLAETNNYGFRNSEDVINSKPKNSFRIITYGGSTTFCYNLSNDDAWPLQLQKILRQKHHNRDQVLNAGAIVWSIAHAYERSKRDIPDLKPDYVIIYSGINEQGNADALALQGVKFEELVRNEKYGHFATNFSQTNWWLRNLLIGRAFQYYVMPIIYKYRDEPNYYERLDPIILQNYLHILEKFISFISNNGGIPVFVVQTHGRISDRAEYLTSYSRHGMTLANNLGAVVVDSEKMIATHDGDPMDLFYTSVHYSKYGAERLADLIYKEVIEKTEH